MRPLLITQHRDVGERLGPWRSAGGAAATCGFHTASQDDYGAPENRVGARLGLCGAVRYTMQGSIPLDFVKMDPSVDRNPLFPTKLYLYLYLYLFLIKNAYKKAPGRP